MATKRRRATRPAKEAKSEDKNFESVGAIWEKESKKGNTFLSISINADTDLEQFRVKLPNGNEVFSLTGFVNTFKEEPKHPDFNIVGFYPDDES